MASCSGSAYGLTRDTGDFVWTYDTREDGGRTEFHGTPIVTKDTILTATDERRRESVAHIYAFARDTGELRWKHAVPVGVMTDFVLEGDTLYYATLREEVVSLNTKTGQEVWRFETGTGNDEFFGTSAPVVTKKHVYFGGVDGRVHALDKKSGKPVWQHELGDRVSTSLVLDGKVLYAGTPEERLYRLSARDGTVLSSKDLPGTPFGRPVLFDGGVFVLTTGGYALALDRDLSRITWHTEIDTDWASFRPIIVGSAVLAGADDGMVRAFDLADGAALWSRKFEGAVTSLTWADPTLFVGTTAGIVYATEFVESKAAAAPRAGAGWQEHCPEAGAGLTDLMTKTDMLVLGEIHGSTEVPAYTHEAVCATLSATPAKPVVLGLEIFSGEQERVDAFLQSSGDADARQALLAGPFWTRSSQDGRASVAMLELIEAARRLVRAGAPLSVLCFDDPNIRPDKDRDHAMGQSVLSHHAGDPDRRYVLLMGNIHANTEVGSHFDPKLHPTTWYLDQKIERLVSLKVRNAPGEYWICNPQCGVKKIGGHGKPDKRGVTMFPGRGAGWDGVIDIGVPTASPPAVRR